MNHKFLLLNVFLFSLIFNLSLWAQGGVWTTKANMPTPRYQHGTCVVNGKIYAMGGETAGNGCNAPGSKSVEEYDPATNTWTIKANMPTARQGVSISTVSGKIYAIGGGPRTCSGQLSTVEEYNPLNNTWSTKTNMQFARTGLSTSVFNGKIYAIGGFHYSSGAAIAKVEEYNPITDAWITKTDMPTARVWLSTSVVDGKIYAFGGHGTVSISLKTVEEYDPIADTWSTKADIPIRLQNSPASSVNGLIYLFGGSTSPGGSPLSVVREYNPISNTWLTISQMPLARVGAHSSELNGKIYVIGGSSTDWPFQPTTTVQVYMPPVTGVEDPSRGEYNPEEFTLHQNYPNPFNPSTTIQYQISKRSEVKLAVFNLLGQLVATLVDEAQAMGIYSIQWDGKDDSGIDVTSGVYLYRLQTNQFLQVKKLALLR